MNICKNCGSRLDPNAAFCPGCGLAVPKTPPEPVPPNITDGYTPPVAYDAAAFEIAKEYVAAIGPSKGLAITALVLMLSIGPAGILTLLIPFSTLLLGLMGVASLVCAIISNVKLSKARKLPVIIPESIDPVSFATYTKAVKDSETAQKMNLTVFILTALTVIAVIGLICVFVLFGISLLEFASNSGAFNGPLYQY